MKSLVVTAWGRYRGGGFVWEVVVVVMVGAVRFW